MNRKSLFAVAVSSVLLGSTLPAQAENVAGTNMSIHFENAILQGAGKKIHMFRVPVVERVAGEGGAEEEKVKMYDVSFDFKILPDGTLGFDRFSSVAVAPHLLNTGSMFIPGLYKGTGLNTVSGETTTFEVSGPIRLSGGRETWTIRAVDSQTLFEAKWATGSLVDHPYDILSSNTEITDGATAAAFGRIERDFRGHLGQSCTQGVIGVTQISNNLLSINSYYGRNGSCNTTNIPFTVLSLTKVN
jgi:hypothetical protein